MIKPLMQPRLLIESHPATRTTIDNIHARRKTICDILQGKDSRLLVVVGPCSIHDEHAALEYAHLLSQSVIDYADELFIVMRTYFEKPRTTLGWKGLITDPDLDGTFNINQGLVIARKLLLALDQLNLPAGTEFLDTLFSHYLSDLISWGSIGARTSESQIHRELASSLPMPVGFKNSTEGNIKIAVDAVEVARHSHHFSSMTSDGIPAVICTTGNPSCHIVLRGSHLATNYSAESIAAATDLLSQAGLPPYLMVDCSHGNSMKNYQNQSIAAECIANQINAGSRNIAGVMLESHLFSGNQAHIKNKKLTYGTSITDACLSWDETKPLLELLATAVKKRG